MQLLPYTDLEKKFAPLTFVQTVFVTHPICVLDPPDIAGDVETNPGPVKFPCTVCGKPVTNEESIVTTVKYGPMWHAL